MTPDDHNALRDFEQVLEITRAMSAAGDLDELLQLIVDRSLDLLQAQRGTVWLYERDRNKLVSRIATGVDELRVPATERLLRRRRSSRRRPSSARTPTATSVSTRRWTARPASAHETS